MSDSEFNDPDWALLGESVRPDILRCLLDGGPVAIGQLSAQIGHPMPVIVRALAPLISGGFVMASLPRPTGD